MAKHNTLGRIEAVWNKLGGEEGVDRLLRGELVVSEAVAKKLLERLACGITIPAVKDFVAAENFVVDTSPAAKVKISDFGTNFERHFLRKVEKREVAAEEVVVNRLLERAFDPAIITALGGEAKVEISLGQFFAAFAKQPNGENGALHTNGWSNVGYIRDDNDVLWAVRGYWGVGGWVFGAYPLDRPRRWREGFQFLSR